MIVHLVFDCAPIVALKKNQWRDERTSESQSLEQG